MEFNSCLKSVKEQQEKCAQYGAVYTESKIDMTVGISLNVRHNEFPIHGLRHPIEGCTTGWYIWSGEYSEDADFFQSLHVKHLVEWNPLILKYLGLAPGWRFLITPDYEDVWQDLNLLEV